MANFFSSLFSKKEVELNSIASEGEIIGVCVENMLNLPKANVLSYVTKQWKNFFDSIPEQDKKLAPVYAKKLIDQFNKDKKVPPGLLTGLYQAVCSLHYEGKIDSAMERSLLRIHKEYHDQNNKKEKPAVITTVPVKPRPKL